MWPREAGGLVSMDQSPPLSVVQFDVEVSIFQKFIGEIKSPTCASALHPQSSRR